MLKDRSRINEKHLKFIRTLPCARCNRAPCEAAHIRIGTDGGMGLKPSDFWTVPLCNRDHTEQHAHGELTFWGDVERARKLARDLFTLTGDKEKAVFRIFEFHRGR